MQRRRRRRREQALLSFSMFLGHSGSTSQRQGPWMRSHGSKPREIRDVGKVLSLLCFNTLLACCGRSKTELAWYFLQSVNPVAPCTKCMLHVQENMNPIKLLLFFLLFLLFDSIFGSPLAMFSFTPLELTPILRGGR